MKSLSSKRYTKALVLAIDKKDELTKTLKILQMITKYFEDLEFSTIINSPTIPKSKKEAFILSIANIKDKKIINFIKLLNQKNRLSEIPEICDELRKFINSMNNEYELVVTSSFNLNQKDLEKIKNELSKKLNISLYIVEKTTQTEGIKLFVDGISVETSFSKNGFSNSLRNHILKAF